MKRGQGPLTPMLKMLWEEGENLRVFRRELRGWFETRVDNQVG